jgi:hypothetical protein
MTNRQRERMLREELHRSEKFMSWTLNVGKVGKGETYSYKGETYTNLITEATEKHYTILEIANMWGISADLARDTFRNVPGVIFFERPGTRTKRSYSTMRVPESVVEQVYNRLRKR